MWLAAKPVVVIRRGAIRIRQQWRMLYAWSNFCAPAPAASAKRFATNWPSVFWARITLTARLLTHVHPVACRVVRRADLLPRWHADLWISRSARIRPARAGFLRAIAGSGVFDRHTALSRWRALIH